MRCGDGEELELVERGGSRMLKLMQIKPLLTRPRMTIRLPRTILCPADQKMVYIIGELVLCNCTERAEGDKMREGRGKKSAV